MHRVFGILKFLWKCSMNYTWVNGTPRKYNDPNIPGSRRPKKLNTVMSWVSEEIEENIDSSSGAGLFPGLSGP